MIQVNLLQDSGSILSASQAAQGSPKAEAKAPIWRSIILAVILIVVGLTGYISWVGVPQGLAHKLPSNLVAILGLQIHEDSNHPAEHTVSTDHTAHAEETMGAEKGSNVVGESVEDIVKTIRPDVFYERERKEYRQLLPSERLVFQKASMEQSFALFNSITPPNFGYTDLVFKIPDMYYARGLAVDESSRKTYLDALKKKSSEFNAVPVPEGQKTLEFTAYGRLPIVKPAIPEVLNLMGETEAQKEIQSLVDLAAKNGVKLQLVSLESEESGLYKRWVQVARSQADFHALQGFAKAFQASKLRIGVLQVSIRPTVTEGLSTRFDFVTYTNP